MHTKLSSRPFEEPRDVSFETAFFLTGIMYLSICIPQVFVYAYKAGRNPIETLLLQDTKSNLRDALGNNIFIDLSDFDTLSIVFSVGVLYGIMNLLLFIIKIELRNTLEIFTSLQAFILSYCTVLLIIFGPRVLIDKLVFIGPYYAKMMYIYLLYLVLELLKQTIISKIRRPDAFKMLSDGIFGILVGFLIVYGSEKELPEIFVGPLFLVCLFMWMIVVDHIYVRLLCATLLLEPELGHAIERLQRRKLKPLIHIRLLLRTLARRLRKRFRMPLPNLINEWERLFAKAFRSEENHPWTVDIRLLALGWPLLMIWPLALYFMVVLAVRVF